MENIALDVYNRKQSIKNAFKATVHLLCSMKLHVSVLKRQSQAKYAEICTSKRKKESMYEYIWVRELTFKYITVVLRALVIDYLWVLYLMWACCDKILSLRSDSPSFEKFLLFFPRYPYASIVCREHNSC